MTTINSINDIRTWIDNAHPDFAGADAERIAEAIRSADHPEWGADWGEWLAANIESLRAEVATAWPCLRCADAALPGKLHCAVHWAAWEAEFQRWLAGGCAGPPPTVERTYWP